MNLAEFNQWVGYLTMAAAAGVLVQLMWLGLVGRYLWLFSYFLADVLQSALTMGVSSRSLWYGYIYFGGQAAKALLAVAVSTQLWLLALRAYPALARFGRRVAIYILLGALLLAAAGAWLLEPPRSTDQSIFPHYFNALEGAVDSMVVLFLVSATLFLLWFPVEVPRNVAVIISGFVFYLFQYWAGLLLVNLYPESAPGISAVLLSLDAAVLIFWIVAIRRKGESVTAVTGHRWNPEEAERLLCQLDAINARLEQAAR
jgi:hypothetical protein